MIRRSVLSPLFLTSASLLLLANPAYASFPLPPRLSALAYASDYTVGQADLMLPMHGNTNQNLYVDPALSYGTDNQNEFDLGVGYRWVHNQAAILGGYLFGGYSRLDNNARIWIANPGIEALGSRWDAHLNGYFPMGDRHANVGTRMNTFFTGHSQVGNLLVVEQFVGSGVDGKVGYQLFPDSSWKAYLGSYFFSPAETRNVWGGAAGVEYWFTQNVKVIGAYSYDKLRRSTYALGLGVEWGGTRLHRTDPTLEERLTDPVERNLAELGRGSKIPTTIKNQSTGITVVLANNIAFFSQTGGPNNGGLGLGFANCTFENPCGPTDFTQTSVNTLGGLLPNTQFYFNGGTYTSSGGTINLISGQSLQSRTADYTQPATDAARSTLISNTLRLQGNNTIQNMILLPSAPGNTGVNIAGANNTIIGSDIGSPSNRPTLGVLSSGNSNTLINNSQIFASGTAYTDGGIGNSTALIQNSVLNVDATTLSPAGGAFGVALSASNNSLTINNSTIDVTNVTPSASTFGINNAGTQNTINMNNSDMRVLSTNSSTSSQTFSINSGSQTSPIVINGGTLIVDSPGGGGTGIIRPLGTPPITIQNGTLCFVNGSSVTCQ